MSRLGNQLRWYRRRLAELARSAFAALRSGGVEAAKAQLESSVGAVVSRRRAHNYQRWFRRRLAERLETPPPAEGPLFSVVVPVYRPPLRELRECVASVLDQSYCNLELVLVDDGGGDPAISGFLQACEARDPRVRSVVLDENLGISGATDAALALATGEYVAFVDHDDLLVGDALALAAARIAADPAVDFVYGDEDKVTEGGRLVEPSFRPDPSLDLLLSYNYMSHPIAVRRTLIAEVGGMRPGFDGAQDHDLALRLADAGARFTHVPEVVYHWRATARSTAGTAAAKPYAYEAGLRSVQDSVKRRGFAAEVRRGGVPGHFEVVFDPPPAGTSVAVICHTSGRVGPVLDRLRYVIDSGLPGLDVRVVVVRDRLDARLQVPRKVRWPKRWAGVTGEVVEYAGWPNAAAALNLGARHAGDADSLLFVSDDVTALGPATLQQLLGHMGREDVGAAGAMTVGPAGAVGQSGIAVTTDGAAYMFAGVDVGRAGHHNMARRIRDVSAVSARFLMTPAAAFSEFGGFPEQFPDVYFDVVYCAQVREAGYRVIVDPTFPVLAEEPGRLDRAAPPSDYEQLAFADFLRRSAPRRDPFLGHGDPALVPPL